MTYLWGLILLAFAAWGQPVGYVTLFTDEPHQVSSGAAAPLLDGSCGIFIGPTFATLVASGTPEWFPQAVMTHEVGHCLGHDHPSEYRESVMIPNIPAPNAIDLASRPGDPWSAAWPHRVVLGGLAHE